MGLVPPLGRICSRGATSPGCRTDLIAHAGIGYVPEDRQIFPTLTVHQNLELGMKRTGRVRAMDLRRHVHACSRTSGSGRDNVAGVLSGGEQQMLTMCRTLMGDPELVIIDEPTEGLAPKLVEPGRRASGRDRPPRRLDPARRAEADDRAQDLAPALRDGPWPHRVRGHARPTSPPTRRCARSASKSSRH